MKKKKYYTIYNNVDDVIAIGFAEECAKQMNTNKRTFFSIISKNKIKRSTYKIIIESVNVDENNNIIDED